MDDTVLLMTCSRRKCVGLAFPQHQFPYERSLANVSVIVGEQIYKSLATKENDAGNVHCVTTCIMP